MSLIWVSDNYEDGKFTEWRRDYPSAYEKQEHVGSHGYRCVMISVLDRVRIYRNPISIDFEEIALKDIPFPVNTPEFFNYLTTLYYLNRRQP